MPSYPHYLPGKQPDDKIVVLEDTAGDGMADRETIFADGLYMPLSFELGKGGVYVSQPPNMWFMKDTTGDGVADDRSEEHTSELQSRGQLVCRLLLEKKKKNGTSSDWLIHSCCVFCEYVSR